MYTKEDILKMVKEILVNDFECDEEKLVPEVKLFEELDLDSIDAVDLIVKLQTIIKKKVNPEDFKQIRTLDDVVVAIEKLVNE
ncbi:MAG: acyl carrier protein [Bdellovibrionota bacterium]|nr:acyl carrier protein [Pseudomonadota bacterium]MDY6089895.1 acyl carrier protein [Bdellovibrionota bacterium]